MIKEDDLIYRNEAIDALIAEVEENGHYRRAIRVIKNLPSAQPAQLEQRWISCSEKLPEIGKKVLLSEPNAMFIAEYYGPENPKGLWLVGGYHHYLADVNRCAWMPLPEPYREEGDK